MLIEIGHGIVGSQDVMSARVRLFILVCLLRSAAAIPAAANEVSSFRLNTCGTSRCIQVESPRAWQSTWNSSFAFSSARLTIYNKHDMKTVRTIEARDVFFDQDAEKILLHSPMAGARGESYYDLQTEELVTLSAGVAR